MTQGWQLVVKDPSWLSGPTVAEIVRDTADGVGARFVVVGEVEGRGEVRPQLFSPDLLVFPIKELVNLAGKMMQFEWGDFFFLRTKEEASEIFAAGSCPSRVSKSLVAIRCVDNTYFYIYGTDSSIREMMLERLEVSESKDGLLSELAYPR